MSYISYISYRYRELLLKYKRRMCVYLKPQRRDTLRIVILRNSEKKDPFVWNDTVFKQNIPL